MRDVPQKPAVHPPGSLRRRGAWPHSAGGHVSPEREKWRIASVRPAAVQEHLSSRWGVEKTQTWGPTERNRRQTRGDEPRAQRSPLTWTRGPLTWDGWGAWSRSPRCPVNYSLRVRRQAVCWEDGGPQQRQRVWGAAGSTVWGGGWWAEMVTGVQHSLCSRHTEVLNPFRIPGR